jgi:hypothetical protein
MTVELVGKVRSTLQSTDHPYMQGAWRPTFNEWNAIFANGDAEVIGTIPDDIEGVYIRTGEVPVHEPIGSIRSASKTAVPAIAAALSAPKRSPPKQRRAKHYGRA